jgi:hypothetical protein
VGVSGGAGVSVGVNMRELEGVSVCRGVVVNECVCA